MAKLVDDKQLLILTRRTDDPGTHDLWSLSLDGSPPIWINDNPKGFRVKEFEITPDGSTVVYVTNPGDPDVNEVFAVPLRLYWNGEQSDQWSDAGNWGSRPAETNRFVPLSATSVIINQGGAQVNVPWQIGSLEVANLTVGTETDSVSVAVAPRVPIKVSRDLSIGQTSEMLIPTTSAIDVLRIDNQGKLQIVFSDERAGTRLTWRFSSFVNGPTGQLIVLDDHTLLLEGDTIENDGSIVAGHNVELQLKGKYIGHGSVNGGHAKIAGTLQPGGNDVVRLDMGDKLSFEHLTPRLTPELEIQIGGTSPGTQHDAVDAMDEVFLDGTLRVFLIADPLSQDPDADVFSPQIGDQFVIVGAEGGVTGRFAAVDVPTAVWGIRYEPTYVALVSLDPASRGDFDANGVIDQADLDLLLLNWGFNQLPAQWINFLPVEAIGQAEMDSVLLNWGRETLAAAETSGLAAVPEPAPQGLVIISVMASCTVLLLRARCPMSRIHHFYVSACVVAMLLSASPSSTAQFPVLPDDFEGIVREFQISPTGSLVALVAEQALEDGGTDALYVAAPDGSSLRLVAGGFREGLVVDEFVFAPNGRDLVYTIGGVGSPARDLRLSGVNPEARLRSWDIGNSPLHDEVISDIAVSPNGSLVHYLANDAQTGQRTLFAAPLELQWINPSGGDWTELANWGLSGSEPANVLPERFTSVVIDRSDGPIVHFGEPRELEIRDLSIAPDGQHAAMLEFIDNSFYFIHSIHVGRLGTLILDDSGARVVSSTVTNHGEMRLRNSAFLGNSNQTLLNSVTGTIVVEQDNDGRFMAIENRGQVIVEENGLLEVFGGFLGNGTEGPGSVQLSGRFSPGLPIGVQRFGGTFEGLRSFGASLDIGGATPGVEHDQIEIAGSLSFFGACGRVAAIHACGWRSIYVPRCQWRYRREVRAIRRTVA